MTKNNFEIILPDDAMEDKNKALGAIIRYARAIINKTDIPGTLIEFGDETPLSTIEIRKKFDMERGNFNHHFTSFKKYMDDKYERKIIPLIEWNSWPDIYSKSTVKEFLVYMNRKTNKYQIVL